MQEGEATSANLVWRAGDGRPTLVLVRGESEYPLACLSVSGAPVNSKPTAPNTGAVTTDASSGSKLVASASASAFPASLQLALCPGPGPS